MIFKRILIVLVVYCMLMPSASCALFEKKDYKKNFLKSALQAEKRNDDTAAFFIYEKTIFYYKDDKAVLEAYAQFCERQKYHEKAIVLYQKLYDLTKDEHYLFKKYSIELQNNKLSSERLKAISEDKRLTSAHRIKINNQFIKQFFYKKDWQATKTYCDKTPKKLLDKESARACSIVAEKLANEKSTYDYLMRYYELSPKNTDTIKKIIAMAEKSGNLAAQEKFIRILSELNPNDKGIKYRLAGFYEKHKQYGKANKVYSELIASGDKSKHVLHSYAYSLKKSKGEPDYVPQSSEVYVPKPLTPYQKKEMALYKALDAKDFKKAQGYLEELLKKTPDSEKLLKLRMDVAMAQDDFKTAFEYFEKTHKKGSLSFEDEKLLAFLYSKNDNLPKALEIIENMLTKAPEDKNLNSLALEYSMAQKNWDKAIVYTEKLLVFTPDDEKLLKSRADLYSTKENFAAAVKYYEALVVLYPKTEYKLSLANAYMANKNYAKAQAIIEPIYLQNPTNFAVIKVYLNTLMAQKKQEQAVCLVKKHRLQCTKEGAIILGDAAMQDKQYASAQKYYTRALRLDRKDDGLRNKLAGAYRMLKQRCCAQEIYEGILAKDPTSKEARLGLGYLNIDKKEYKQARSIFRDLLAESPDYTPAKVGITHSYINNGDNFQTLSSLRQIPVDDEVKFMKAQTYYKMNMLSDAKDTLQGVVTKDAEDLKYQIKRDQAIAITPSYTYFNQILASEFKLDYNKVGLNATQGIRNNLNIFTDYNMYAYSSGYLLNSQNNVFEKLNNVTQEVRLGVMGRPTTQNEFRADIGAKFFQFNQGNMINTDTWIKHYYNDKLALKLGFWRNNLEQSYLSAVGVYMNNNQFTGQVADNRTYLEYEYRLPKQFYSFGRCSYGVMQGQNLPSNPYMEGMVGIGRLLYNDPDNKWINTVNLDLVSYNSGYKYNLLNLYNNAGVLYGGYFSPTYFNADTVNLKLEGKIKKWKLKYGLKTFGGAQFAVNPNQSHSTWGIAPYLCYDFNDNVSMNLAYSYFNYADLQRNIFMFNFVFRGFKRRAKS